jgi:hypothetical protein
LTAGHPAASNAFVSPAPIAVASGFSAPITNPVSATAQAVPPGFVSSAFTGLAARNARSTRTRDTPSAFWSAAAFSGHSAPAFGAARSSAAATFPSASRAAGLSASTFGSAASAHASAFGFAPRSPLTTSFPLASNFASVNFSSSAARSALPASFAAFWSATCGSASPFAAFSANSNALNSLASATS